MTTASNPATNTHTRDPEQPLSISYSPSVTPSDKQAIVAIGFVAAAIRGHLPVGAVADPGRDTRGRSPFDAKLLLPPILYIHSVCHASVRINIFIIALARASISFYLSLYVLVYVYYFLSLLSTDGVLYMDVLVFKIISRFGLMF